MSEILFLQPQYKELIWGGNSLATKLGYDAPDGKIGEAWVISAHKEGDCKIINGKFAGKTLGEVYANNKHLFGNCASEQFPLMSKVIDALEDLSIQVHPDDEYAHAHENGSLGKSECWLVLDCKPGATIVLGQKCKSRNELAQKMKDGKWDEILVEKPIHPGDFMQIDPGTVHAIKAGTIILENQQSSTNTYRVYDYNRLQNGEPRKLHTQKALDVINYDKPAPTITNYSKIKPGFTTLESNDKYTVSMLNNIDTYKYHNPSQFICCNVIEGHGEIITKNEKNKISKNDNFIITSLVSNFTIDGSVKLVFTTLS